MHGCRSPPLHRPSRSTCRCRPKPAPRRRGWRRHWPNRLENAYEGSWLFSPIGLPRLVVRPSSPLRYQCYDLQRSKATNPCDVHETVTKPSGNASENAHLLQTNQLLVCKWSYDVAQTPQARAGPFRVWRADEGSLGLGVVLRSDWQS